MSEETLDKSDYKTERGMMKWIVLTFCQICITILSAPLIIPLEPNISLGIIMLGIGLSPMWIFIGFIKEAPKEEIASNIPISTKQEAKE